MFKIKLTNENSFVKIFNKKYNVRENPITFILGLIFISSMFILSFTLIMSLFFIILTYSLPFFEYVLYTVLTIFGILILLAFLKYIITGNARPFIKIETGEGKFKISLFNWR